MSCEVDIKLNDKEQKLILNKVAKQADSSIWWQEGNTVMLATLTYNPDEVIEEDFVPLVVQYVERAYAVGKIPAGFVKREQKPGDFETLTARIVDRSLRPLFPRNYGYDTIITIMALSADEDSDLQVAAMNAAAACMYMSSLPFAKMVHGVRITRIDGKLVVNPSLSELEKGDFNLFVTGTKDELLMIEYASQGQEEIEIIPVEDIMLDGAPIENTIVKYKTNEISEDELIEALKLAQEKIKEGAEIYEEALKNFVKEKVNFEERKEVDLTPYIKEIKEKYADELREIIKHLSKSERDYLLKQFARKIASALGEEENFDAILKAVKEVKREIVRGMILYENVRADGRKLDEIRPISIETNVLPRAHGSCLFTRGQTQALAVATRGSEMDAQVYANLTDKEEKLERFMLHYNFPAFAVGEAVRLGPPSRRELGHGNLAKRAIEPLIDPEFDETVRVVSEILESNGSSSMATVCASAIALKAAKVPLLKLAAGIAMGMVSEGDKYAILTDIMGLEDHDGDMDFKVAGTWDGITAMQMDIKLGGISLDILKEALYQAKEARAFILEKMENAVENIKYNEDVLPKSVSFKVEPDKIIDIIGTAGKTVKEIIAKFGITIDLDRETGKVKIYGDSYDQMNAAKDYILNVICKDDKPKIPNFEIGSVIEGTIKRKVPFGMFVEIAPDVEGLLHISKLNGRSLDEFEEGQKIKVKVLSQSGFKIELALAE
ncbi:polyribonucleotide nucleotidyltransferase [Caminibacter pacificus]|jgi:polyribonucleotide nucleotidyltransferase|uniref:Polyribonucleotide nucleotidyltransferase n=1 Tax=Caminibacter pacificus TaxID=1424653 RepID=A0AAJ4RDL1_9BACT|nr:polyribonucleotide nucleotidyltransferase [Caminibacter pacificus]NPA87827.1 polyribonucleotide nucleotidyltransferase [Campylobacterota bacterium]QCI28475.1 polyribonucleotide nucleotidyltransferase [Caminibacter pacificus]ROR40798.1 polyribonucleotide nucleotidyltransferase [Caminibacter pacificus]